MKVCQLFAFFTIIPYLYTTVNKVLPVNFLSLPPVPLPRFEGGTSEGRRYGLQGSKVPPSQSEGMGFKSLGDYLQGSWRYNLYPLRDYPQHPWEVS